MKKTNRTSFFLIGLLLLGLVFGCTREDVRQYAPIEKFPDDTLLETIEKKRAMMVIAHDDDMCAMAGTASLLNKNGWEIAVISFSKTPERNNAQIKACESILDTVFFVELKPKQMRNDNEEERKGYYAFPKDSFDVVFNKVIIENKFIEPINKFDPTIIFTLDNELGGYGHPEHILISQMVIDLSKTNRIMTVR